MKYTWNRGEGLEQLIRFWHKIVLTALCTANYFELLYQIDSAFCHLISNH